MTDISRGKYIGKPISAPPAEEAGHFHEVPGLRRLGRLPASWPAIAVIAWVTVIFPL